MVIALAPEVIRMATRTVGLELRTWPDVGFRVAGMAVVTCKVATVIERFVTQGRMAKHVRNPGAGAMTVVTLARRHEVTRVSSRRNNAVMTG